MRDEKNLSPDGRGQNRFDRHVTKVFSEKNVFDFVSTELIKITRLWYA